MAEMTPERFAAILDAYGAEPRRWPEAERPAALAHLHAAPDAVARLEAAADVDDLLGPSRLPAPSIALHRRVIASAQARRAWRRAGLWWSGLALAGAAAAGALTGTAAAAVFEPVLHIPGDAHQDATAFGAFEEQGE